MHTKLKQSVHIYSSCVIISKVYELYRSQTLLQFVIPFVLTFSIFYKIRVAKYYLKPDIMIFWTKYNKIKRIFYFLFFCCCSGKLALCFVLTGGEKL